MKKIILILSLPLLLGAACSNMSLNQEHDGPKVGKKECQTADDCAISGADPEGFETCVNKQWNDWLDEDPQARGGVLWQCISTEGAQCGCIDNKCQRIDSNESCS